MKALDDMKKILLLHKTELIEKYKVNEMGIFGSYLHNVQREDSDIDILVNFGDCPVYSSGEASYRTTCCES